MHILPNNSRECLRRRRPVYPPTLLPTLLTCSVASRRCTVALTAPCPAAALSTAKHWAAACCALLLASASAGESSHRGWRAKYAGNAGRWPLWASKSSTQAPMRMPAQGVCGIFPWHSLALWHSLRHPPVPASVSCASRVSAEALGAPLLTRAWKKDWRASRAEPAAAGAAAGERSRKSRVSSKKKQKHRAVQREDCGWGKPPGGPLCCLAICSVCSSHPPCSRGDLTRAMAWGSTCRQEGEPQSQRQ